ncbi:MAG: permease of phosphate ABC transporter [Dorea sp.]|nr:permease of phosphate ABC transporter [Dorea sp.]
MKKVFELGNRYAAQSDWTDFAFTKFCLCSMGVLIGTLIPKKHTKTAQGIAGGIFLTTYVVLMKKVIAIIMEMAKEE